MSVHIFSINFCKYYSYPWHLTINWCTQMYVVIRVPIIFTSSSFKHYYAYNIQRNKYYVSMLSRHEHIFIFFLLINTRFEYDMSYLFNNLFLVNQIEKKPSLYPIQIKIVFIKHVARINQNYMKLSWKI